MAGNSRFPHIRFVRKSNRDILKTFFKIISQAAGNPPGRPVRVFAEAGALPAGCVRRGGACGGWADPWAGLVPDPSSGARTGGTEKLADMDESVNRTGGGPATPPCVFFRTRMNPHRQLPEYQNPLRVVREMLFH
jgi:hypothetical protein